MKGVISTFQTTKQRSNKVDKAKTHATKILNELKALDKSMAAMFYDMGRLLYALSDLTDVLGYTSISALIEAELIVKPATGMKYLRTYRHFKRLHYSRKDALALIEDISFTHVAEQIPWMKQRGNSDVVQKRIDAEDKCFLTFQLSHAQRRKARKVLATYGAPRDSENFIRLINKLDKKAAA